MFARVWAACRDGLQWFAHHHQPISSAATIFGVLAAFFAGLVALAKYLDETQHAKERLSEFYVGVYWDPDSDVYKSRIFLESFWSEEDQLAFVAENPANKYPAYAHSIVKQDKIHKSHVLHMHGFHERVAKCVLAEKCSEALACASFSEDAYDFAFLYAEFFDDVSKRLSQNAKTVRNLTGNIDAFSQRICGERGVE